MKDITEMMNSIIKNMKEQMKNYNEVSRVTDEVKEKSGEIITATEGQKERASHIIGSVTEIEELMEGNAGGSDKMAGNAESVATMAELLRRRVDFFKTGK